MIHRPGSSKRAMSLFLLTSRFEGSRTPLRASTWKKKPCKAGGGCPVHHESYFFATMSLTTSPIKLSSRTLEKPMLRTVIDGVPRDVRPPQTEQKQIASLHDPPQDGSL